MYVYKLLDHENTTIIVQPNLASAIEQYEQHRNRLDSSLKENAFFQIIKEESTSREKFFAKLFIKKRDKDGVFYWADTPLESLETIFCISEQFMEEDGIAFTIEEQYRFPIGSPSEPYCRVILEDLTIKPVWRGKISKTEFLDETIDSQHYAYTLTEAEEFIQVLWPKKLRQVNDILSVVKDTIFNLSYDRSYLFKLLGVKESIFTKISNPEYDSGVQDYLFKIQLFKSCFTDSPFNYELYKVKKHEVEANLSELAEDEFFEVEDKLYSIEIADLLSDDYLNDGQIHLSKSEERLGYKEFQDANNFFLISKRFYLSRKHFQTKGHLNHIFKEMADVFIKDLKEIENKLEREQQLYLRGFSYAGVSQNFK